MDVRIEAAPMAADARMATPSVKMNVVSVNFVTAAPSRVASFSCPSISGHSISAVAPDHNFKEELAKAA